MSKVFDPTSHAQVVAPVPAGEIDAILTKVAAGEMITAAEFAQLAIAALTDTDVAAALATYQTAHPTTPSE